MWWKVINQVAHVENLLKVSVLYRVGHKTGPFLNLDNFAMVSDRKVWYVKSLQILSRKKLLNLHGSVFKYSLPNLHKYSLSLKLHWQ